MLVRYPAYKLAPVSVNQTRLTSRIAARRCIVRRSFRFALGFVIILSVAAGTARAIDWGWGGWGGWVDTPEGALARGMGQYYEGLGVLNKKTAMADAINVDTMIRWNEYLYDAHLEATRRMVARRRANSERVRALAARSSRTCSRVPRHATSKTATRSMRSSRSSATRGFPHRRYGRRPHRSKPARFATFRSATRPKP